MNENKFRRVNKEAVAKRIEKYAERAAWEDQRRAELQRLANVADAELDRRRREYKTSSRNTL